MNNIMLSSSALTMSSYDLWLKLNELRSESDCSIVRHVDFLLRIEDEIDDLGVYDFFAHPQNNIKIRFYKLNEDQILLVGMRESKIVRKKVLGWLKSLTKPDNHLKIPTNFAEALQLAADQAKQLELAAPKVAFVENLVERNTLMTATQIAQKHGMSAIKLNKFLDELGGVYSKGIKRGRAFIQSFLDKGYGEVKQTELGHSQCLFSPSGEVWIHSQLISEGVI